jgi:hypothetical protein
MRQLIPSLSKFMSVERKCSTPAFPTLIRAVRTTLHKTYAPVQLDSGTLSD